MAYVRQHPYYPNFRVKQGIMPEYSAAIIADQENLLGKKDGVNREFFSLHKPLRHSERIYKDGMMMARSFGEENEGDYQIDYNTGRILFSEHQVPQPKSVIKVSYKHMGSS